MNRKSLLPLLICLSFVSRGNAEPLRLGVLVPLSGEMSPFGEKALRGVELAKEELPAVEFFVEDVGTGASHQVVTATSKLITQRKVDAVIGEFFLDQTLVAAPITERAKIPLFSQTLCSEEVAKLSLVTCGYPSTAEQLASLGSLFKKLGSRRIALLIENSSYGEDTLRIVRPIVEQLGVAVVADERTNAGERDFRTLITRMLKRKPDVVFAVTADPGQSFSFFQQLKQLGYDGARIGYLDIDPKYLAEFGASIEGVYLPGLLAPQFSETFTKRYRARFQQEPEMYSALAYDLTRLVALGARAGSSSPLQNVLTYRTQDPAVPGYHLNADRTVSLPTFILQIRNGAFEKAH